MFFYEGYICPVCGEKFHESDDIVVCPDCGAPHHRACWQKENRCHYAADHGTPRQWRRPEESAHTAPPVGPGSVNPSPAGPPSAAYPGTRDCPHCGQQNPEFAEFCSRCGREMPASEWKSTANAGNPVQPPPVQPGGPYQPYGAPPPYGGYGEYIPVHAPINDPYGGLPREEKIADATADELAAYVGPNSSYYLPRFHKMAHAGARVSWNWAAFLISPFWLFYRKCYVAGGVALALNALSSVLSGYIYNAIIYPVLSGGEITIAELVAQAGYRNYLLIMLLLNVAVLMLSVIFGMVGNYVYYRECIKRTGKLRQANQTGAAAPLASLEAASYRRELGSAGGVSMLWVAISLSIQWICNMMLNIFIWMQGS